MTEGIPQHLTILAGDLPDGPQHDIDLIASAYLGDIDGVREALRIGANINAVARATGLSALHIAAGRDDLALCKLLVEHGARFFPDRFGRWPTLVAAQCRVSDEVSDFIVEQEAAASDEGQSPTVPPVSIPPSSDTLPPP